MALSSGINYRMIPNFPRPPKWNLEDLLQQDPFYQSGAINLKNVKPFEADPTLQSKVAPTFESPALAQAKADFMGYTYPGSPELYVKNLDNPNMETAATVTHEGIHNVLPQELIDLVAKDAGSALGPQSATFRYDPEREDNPWQDYAYLGADYTRNEMMTRYLENQIYGDEIAPFEEWMGGTEAYTGGSSDEDTGYFNYITMDRPGEGPLGMEGLRKILHRRGYPFLKQTAARAHQNIEARAAQKAQQAAAAAAAASSPYSGQGAQGGGGGSNIGGGQQTSRGPVGGAVTHSQARDARGGMSGWGLSRGGLASLYG